jgi:hypothetical protein
LAGANSSAAAMKIKDNLDIGCDSAILAANEETMRMVPSRRTDASRNS